MVFNAVQHSKKENTNKIQKLQETLEQFTHLQPSDNVQISVLGVAGFRVPSYLLFLSMPLTCLEIISWWTWNEAENGISDLPWAFSSTINLICCFPIGRAPWAPPSRGSIYWFTEAFSVLSKVHPLMSHPCIYKIAAYDDMQRKNLECLHSCFLLCEIINVKKIWGWIFILKSSS